LDRPFLNLAGRLDWNRTPKDRHPTPTTVRSGQRLLKVLSTTGQFAIECELASRRTRPHSAAPDEPMSRIEQIVAPCACLILFAQITVEPSATLGGQGATIAGDPAPTAVQIKSLISRTIENQHQDDRALTEFERVEHVVTRKGENAEILSDRTSRVLASGTGTLKLPMQENGAPVPATQYRSQLEYAVSALELAVHPNDRYKQDLVKFERRRRERADLVDEAAKAFHITWQGRETRADASGAHAPRTFVKLLLEPDPDYKPPTRFAAIFQHVRATLWLDESQAQFARLEGDIASDVLFGGGIAGRIYRGGRFVIEQAEVAPGIWLPSLYTYDVDGRKFLFAFGIHERTEVTRYRRIGPPTQAVETLRSELNSLGADPPAVTRLP